MPTLRIILDETPQRIKLTSDSDTGIGTTGLGQLWCESEKPGLFAMIYDANGSSGILSGDDAAMKRTVISQGTRFPFSAGAQSQVQNINSGFNFGWVWGLVLHSCVGTHADPTASSTLLVCDRDATFACFLRGAAWDAPAKDSNISIQVDSTADLATFVANCAAAVPPLDPIVGIDTMGWYRVITVDDATHFTGENLDIACAPVTVFTS